MQRRLRSISLALPLGLAFAAGAFWTTAFVVEGRVAGDRFGSALAALGDVDGDGRGDLAVGAPHADVGAPNGGVLRVLSGATGRVLATAAGDDSNDRLGAALAAAGDHDGDGLMDVLVGAPMGSPASGEVRVVRGVDGATLRTYAGSAAGERFGAALAGLGDLDGDGIPDLAVGAPEADAAGSSSGRVVLLSGRSGALLREHVGAAWDRFGTSIASPGDLDGDGRADLLVGAPFSDGGGFNAGSVLAFSGADGSLLFDVHGAGPGDRLGERVAAAGDVDGDGIPDLVAVAPGEDGVAVDSGVVRVLSGLDGRLLLTVSGETSGEFLSAAAGAGDVDGDGRADVLVGSSAAGTAEGGRVRLVSGSSGLVLASFDGARPGGWLGAAVAGLGDEDGDGRFELACGAPGHDDRPDALGRVRVLRAPPAPGPRGSRGRR